MPELPEVEVVKKSLEGRIKNLIIKKVIINDKKLRYKLRINEFNKLIGKKVLDVKRRSKFLLFFFENKVVMMVHFGMTGKFLIQDNHSKISRTSFYYNVTQNNNKHNKVILIFNEKLKLIYNDVRKFGFIKIFTVDEIHKNKHLKLLGPEPLTNKFNYIYFKNYVISRNRNIKNLLMDQRFVSGLGNIYVNETLYYCKINPNKNIKNLKKDEITKLVYHIKRILKKAIISGGSSIKNFSDSKGNEGNFQQEFKVYGKLGNKCNNYNCKGIIKKIVQSNRASFYCPKCQK